MSIRINGHGNTSDGIVYGVSTVRWESARDLGGTADNNNAQDQYAVRARMVTSGRGSTQWAVYRAFLAFDTSAITSVPVSGTIHIRGYSSGTADIRVVKSTHHLPLVNGDMQRIYNWTSGVDNSGNVTYYDTAEVTTWSTSGFNTIVLSKQALIDIAEGDTLQCCLIEADYDLTDNEPSIDPTDIYSGCYFNDSTDSSKRPYVTIHPDNSTFFGTNF